MAKLNVEEIMQDRQKLGDEIAEGIKGDLLAQGLVLDSLAIQDVIDRNGCIEALGAQEVERVKREAEVARIEAAREVKARQLSTEEANLIEQTAFDKNTAASKSEVGRANAEAEQAENLARAGREQAVLVQRAEVRQAELDADAKRVADAEKYRMQTEADAEAYGRQKRAETDRQVAQQESDAEALRAKSSAEAEALRAQANAEAEAIRAKGEASAAAIQAEAEALRENQEAILGRELIGQLPALMVKSAKGYQNVGNWMRTDIPAHMHVQLPRADEPLRILPGMTGDAGGAAATEARRPIIAPSEVTGVEFVRLVPVTHRSDVRDGR